MPRRGPAAERLRAYVRERVSPTSAKYERGNPTRLAKAIGVVRGWVTEYVADPPTAHADLDKGLAICAFYGISPADLSKPTISEPKRLEPLSVGLDEALKKGASYPLAWASVNALRESVRLPIIGVPPGRTGAGGR